MYLKTFVKIISFRIKSTSSLKKTKHPPKNLNLSNGGKPQICIKYKIKYSSQRSK